MINVAVVGLGYWGPNLVRNLASLGEVNISALCDMYAARAETVAARYCPRATIVKDHADLLDHKEIDAVIVATPIQTHYAVASAFLGAGKHVFVEKPLARTGSECRTLINLAERYRRVLMVDHVFEYSAAVQRIKAYLDQRELGKLLHVYSQRLNLGRIQTETSALWSFGPHDLSILNYWLGHEPLAIAARGFAYITTGAEDVVFLSLEYPGGINAHLHLGWLDPRKVRLMTLVGTKKMLVYDDVNEDARIQLYDKGVVQLDDYLEAPESFPEFLPRLRVGDVLIPAVSSSEPLQAACRHFVDCVRAGQRPRTDGASGLRVVRVLEAAEESLRQGGRTIALHPEAEITGSAKGSDGLDQTLHTADTARGGAS
ncbi:MAG TPA: Gfo/Idh/MocA family oxidoreductase [bacterium]|nr:Gfo/Idh/MocA family oxidoreductase [bacterium]